jgi:hypothetical protein
LELVEKMVKKALEQGQFTTFQEYSLCLLISDQDMKILEPLLHVPSETFPAKLDYIKWKCNLLHRLGRLDDLYQYARQLDPSSVLLNDWEILSLYFDAAVSLRKHGQYLEEDIVFWNCESLQAYQKRDYYLADIELAARLDDKGILFLFTLSTRLCLFQHRCSAVENDSIL